MDYIAKAAQELGVSKSTICRALSSSQNISTDTKKMVLGYLNEKYPEKMAARKRQQSTRKAGIMNITVIMPYKPQYFWNQAIKGMEDAIRAFALGKIALKYIFYSGTLSEYDLLYALDEFDIEATDALAVVPVDSDMVVEKIRSISDKIPVALFNEYCAECGSFISVVSDGYKEGCEIGKMYLDSMGDNSSALVLLTESYRSKIVSDRISGFLDTVRGAKVNGRIPRVDTEALDFGFDFSDSKYKYDYNTILPSRIARMIAERSKKSEALGFKVSSVYIPNGSLHPLFIALRKLDMLNIRVYGHEINPSSLEFYMSGIRGGYIKEDVYYQGYTAIHSLILKLLDDMQEYPKKLITRFDSCKFI